MNNVEELGRYSKRLMQRFWDPVPKYDDASPIWCLGKCYEAKDPHPELQELVHVSPPESSESEASHTSQTSSYLGVESTETQTSDKEQGEIRQQNRTPTAEDESGWPKPFLDDFEARVWLTYRSNFPEIAKSPDPKATAGMSLAVRLKSMNQGGFTSDTGWGCMIRSGQSILANALFILKLGRDWRRGSQAEEERKLLSLFADDPKAQFSLHKFVEYGASACGKHPGEWFGPSATARSIQALANDFTESPLRVYITCDSADVYQDSFFKIAKPDGETFHPTLILVSIRLGIDRVTPVYWEALKNALQMPQSVGIAGGRPSASHYFIGTQSQSLLYLDPHTTRPLLPYHPLPTAYTAADIDTCHTRRIRRLHLREMDPSMLIAFLVRDEAEWRAWRKDIACVQGKPIVHVADAEPVGQGRGAVEREGAIDEVEAFGDSEDEEGGGLK